MKPHYALFLLLFSLFMVPVSGQNKIEKSKNELSEKSNSGSASSKSKVLSDDTDTEGLSVLGEIAWKITFGVLIGNYETEDHLESNLTPYPFYNGTSGNYQNAYTDTVATFRSRFDLEDRFIYSDNNLFGNHFKAKIRPFHYFYLQADYHQLFEFNKVQNTSDGLSLLHFNVCYDRIRLEKFNFGWNLGVSYVANGVNTAGFTYGLSADYFMDKRFSFAGAAKWSQINGHPVNVYELQAKFHKKNYFFTFGFEHMKIASPKYNLIAIGGGIYF